MLDKRDKIPAAAFTEMLSKVTGGTAELALLQVIGQASGPEGPDRWNEHLAVSWQGPDTLAVTYDDTVRMWRTLTSLPGVNVVYTQLARTGL